VYCANNLTVLYSLANDSASSVEILQDTHKDSNELKVLKTNFAYINANLSFVMQSIAGSVKTKNLVLGTIKEICDVHLDQKQIK
jgi:hypothetical protein